jgi:hypothetical protein
MIQYVENTCEIMCEDNGRRMVGDILSFREYDHVAVSVDKSIKLDMKWNGHTYEGKMAGLSFTTDGPLIKNVKQGRR